MTTTQPKFVQVVLTAGPSELGRAVLGLEAALAATASAVQVEVFLTLDATEWACEPRERKGGAPVYLLLDQLSAMGANVTCCSSCALDLCGAPTDQVGEPGATASATRSSTTPSIEIIGLATMMERVAAGVPTITF